MFFSCQRWGNLIGRTVLLLARPGVCSTLILGPGRFPVSSGRGGSDAIKNSILFIIGLAGWRFSLSAQAALPCIFPYFCFSFTLELRSPQSPGTKFTRFDVRKVEKNIGRTGHGRRKIPIQTFDQNTHHLCREKVAVIIIVYRRSPRSDKNLWRTDSHGISLKNVHL